MANTTEPFKLDRIQGSDQFTARALEYIANRASGMEYQMTQQTELLRELVQAIKSASQARR
jgi:hypothetical protein